MDNQQQPPAQSNYPYSVAQQTSQLGALAAQQQAVPGAAATQGYTQDAYSIQHPASQIQQPAYQAQGGYASIPYQPQVKQPSGWARLWAAFGLAFAVLLIQTISTLVALPTHSDSAMIATGEIVGGLAAILFIVLVGGKKLATPSMRGMREAWHVLRWLFLADGVLVLIEAIDVAVTGSFELAPLWPLRVIMLALMCAGIGLFEEGTFRGLVFHGLLSRMGTNKKGIFWAIIISSLIFGAMHIDPVSTDLTDPLQLLQAVLKIAQTGIFGFAAAVVVLKTENLWPVALLHGLNDFMLMLSEIGLEGEPLVTEYVSAGSDAWAIVAIYLVLCAAYAPCIVSAARMLKTIDAPNRGSFYRAAAQPVQAYAPAVHAPAAYAVQQPYVQNSMQVGRPYAQAAQPHAQATYPSAASAVQQPPQQNTLP